jgi:RNA polymerase-binding transcription factor DksA
MTPGVTRSGERAPPACRRLSAARRTVALEPPMPTPTKLRLAPLSLDQRTHIERRLLEERARALRTLDRCGRLKVAEAEDHTPQARMPDHMAELGSDTMQETIDAVIASRETAALREIDAALNRLYREPSRFGVDEVTGEPIPFERLDIIPWARRRASAA